MITFLREPSAYYALLLEVFERSDHSILLSALYLGGGPLEQALIDAADRALERKPALEVKLLLDYNRAHRSKDSSLPALRALVKKHGPRLRVLLYETPLSSFEAAMLSLPLVPEEAREMCGVYHCKFCVSDGMVVLTGANLSREYFQDRQDRYALVDGDSELAAFLRAFADILDSYCHRVLPSGSTAPPPNSLYLPGSSQRLRAQLLALSRASGEGGSFIAALRLAASSGRSARFIPMLQNRCVGLEEESMQLPALLDELRVLGGIEGYDVTIATPYPNFTPPLLQQLGASLASGAARSLSIVVPSLSSHGFANAKGARSLVPLMHSHVTHSSLGEIAAQAGSSGGELRPLRYSREGWTFHGKGVWMLPRDPAAPVITYIGSSNFGLRSWWRDFELGFVFVAHDAKDKAAVHEEVTSLHKYTHRLPLRRQGSLGPVALLSRALRSFL